MTRHRKINYEQIIKNTVDQYPYGWVHGLQKDAIQNSWDAKAHKKGKDWKIVFDIISIESKEFFTIQDFGTYGLTGNKIADDYNNIALIPEEERWAKFECYGATKDEVDSLGSRGQGKFLFIHASEQGRLFYESIRDDKTYKFGFTEKYGDVVGAFGGEKAKIQIRNRVGIGNIVDQGTRVIIESPKQELVEDYGQGFLEAIEETWWPLIRKYGIKIILRREGKNYRQAKEPNIFVNSYSSKDKELHNIVFEYGRKNNKKEGRIKHLYIACSDSGLPKRFIGITVFRHGMKVLNIPYKGSVKYNNKVFGYIEFDNKTDHSLREIEQSNHYGFRESESLWRVAEETIENEINEFAAEKLGIGRKEEHIEEKDAQHKRKVSRLLNQLLNQFKIPIDFSVPGPAPNRNSSSSSSNSKLKKDICIYDDKVSYTDDDIKRIAFGNILKCSCKVKGYILGKLRIRISIYSSRTELIAFKDSYVNSIDVSAHRKINKADFDKGKYRVVFRLIRDIDQYVLDEKVHTLWIENYPSGKSPFNIEYSNFKGERKDMEWDLDHREKELLINAEHPYRQYIDQQGDDMTTKHDAEIGFLAAIDFTVWRVEMNEIEREEIIKSNELFEDLLSSRSSRRINAVLRIQGKIRQALYGSKK